MNHKSIVSMMVITVSGLLAASELLAGVPVDKLDLNRRATKLSNPPGLSHVGFRWQSGDNETTDWRPQGIAGMVKGDRKYLIISWYHLDTYKGVRLSFVDVTNMNDVRYRHVLLLDASGAPLAGVHAGGLVYRRGEIHVPDTKAGKVIRVYDIDHILEVPKAMRKVWFNYRYAIRQSRAYSVDIKPSFMSYDWDRDRFLTGTFQLGDSKSDSCSRDYSKSEYLLWYGVKSSQKQKRGPFFNKMQGAAAADGKLWIATSYGRSNSSCLRVARYSPNNSSVPAGHSWQVYKLPPGLEDLHASKSSNNLWLLTEFGPNEGSGNNRIVFAIRRDRFSP